MKVCILYEISRTQPIPITNKSASVQVKIHGMNYEADFLKHFGLVNGGKAARAGFSMESCVSLNKSFRLRREATLARISSASPLNSQRPGPEQSFYRFQERWSSTPKKKYKKVSVRKN